MKTYLKYENIHFKTHFVPGAALRRTNHCWSASTCTSRLSCHGLRFDSGRDGPLRRHGWLIARRHLGMGWFFLGAAVHDWSRAPRSTCHGLRFQSWPGSVIWWHREFNLRGYMGVGWGNVG